MIVTDPIITVDVVTEPVTLADAKRHMNMQFDTDDSYDFTDDDIYIGLLIPVCRQAVELYTGRSLAPKTIQVSVEGQTDLPYGPVNNIVSVDDEDGAIDAEDYTIRGGTVIKPTCGYTTIVYEAGYTVLPASLKHAILEEIAYRYHHRGEEIDISGPARSLARAYRIVTWLA